MQSNVKEVTDSNGNSDFIASFGLPLLGGAKFTPKVAFKDMSVVQAKKLFNGDVEGYTVFGRINSDGYGVFTVAVNATEVGTISYYPSDLDNQSSVTEVAKVTEELVEKLKGTVVTQTIEDGADMMADW